MVLALFLSSVALGRKKRGQSFSLADLLVRARSTNPVMAVARAQLKDYLAQFDRAYYAWTPRLNIDALLAPLPRASAAERMRFIGAANRPYE